MQLEPTFDKALARATDYWNRRNKEKVNQRLSFIPIGVIRLPAPGVARHRGDVQLGLPT